jgi:hypothetical protein
VTTPLKEIDSVSRLEMDGAGLWPSNVDLTRKRRLSGLFLS